MEEADVENIVNFVEGKIQIKGRKVQDNDVVETIDVVVDD